MVRIIERFFNKIAWSLYQRAKHIESETIKSEQGKYITTGVGTILSRGTVINNQSLDKSKIIIGVNSWLNEANLAIFGHGGKIIIGDNSFVGPNTCIWSSAQISIGNNVLISHNVNIHDNNSHSIVSKERETDYLYIKKNFKMLPVNTIEEKPITIGDNVWIGFNAVILKGVNVGKGAIVGANTLITKDVPDFAVIVGNPARIVKYTI